MLDRQKQVSFCDHQVPICYYSSFVLLYEQFLPTLSNGYGHTTSTKRTKCLKKGKTFENLSTFSSVCTSLLYNLFSWYFTFLSFPDLWREYRRKIISAHDILERLRRKSVKEQGKTFRNWCHQTKWLTTATPKVLLFNLCTYKHW